MLFPQTNRCRTILDLSGFWQIRVDQADAGEKEAWFNGFSSEAEIGVPGSWNEQLAELGMMNYVGTLWYQKAFRIPQDIEKKRILLRIGSAEYSAKVWVNGKLAGTHEGGSLPFEFDISEALLIASENKVVIRVNNELSNETIPQGVNSDDFKEYDKQREETFPPVNFDYFPYGGLSRPIKLCALDEHFFKNIVLKTRVLGSRGEINYRIQLNEPVEKCEITVRVFDKDTQIKLNKYTCNTDHINGSSIIQKGRFWSPKDPHLYRLHVEMRVNDILKDEYILPFGVREISVQGDQLLLNHKPIFLKGFGRHEDFPVLGKGFSHTVAAKDIEIMKWIGANSFRTTHYPYAEEAIGLADRHGFLVINEIPAVSLNMSKVNSNTLHRHKQMIKELIERDNNHPSVIMWSIGNEPGIWGEKEAVSKSADQYWKTVYEYTKKMDNSRPVILPVCSKWGKRDIGLKYSDIISLNRYWGWYENPAELDKAENILRREIEEFHDLYKKPIFLSEFGADSIEGYHAAQPQLFTEEYQVALIKKYFEIIESYSFTVGEHVWNLTDFRTAQHHRRAIFNKKGVFNRQRAPKSVAYTIRKHWKSELESEQ